MADNHWLAALGLPRAASIWLTFNPTPTQRLNATTHSPVARISSNVPSRRRHHVTHLTLRWTLAGVCIAASKELPGAGQCAAPTSVGRNDDAMRVVAGSGAPKKGRYAGLWSVLASLALAETAPDTEAGAGVVRPVCSGVADGTMVGAAGTPLPLPAAGCTTDGAVALTVALASGGP